MGPSELVKTKHETLFLKDKQRNRSLRLKKGWIMGIVLTFVIATISGNFVKYPFFSVLGVMIMSILLGMAWKWLMGVPEVASSGITFSSKVLLRLGIILMGLRLNLEQIIAAGITTILIDVSVIVFTITFMLLLGKLLSIDRHLSALIAVGTAVCGAAAIVAVAPLIGAKKESTAISVAFIAILGTIVSVFYSFSYGLLGLDQTEFGILTGATLHELAHVIAAASPGGDISTDTALLVKLGRVVLLIPVAIGMSLLFNRHTDKAKSYKALPVPWFIIGFLFMCIVNTYLPIPRAVVDACIGTSVFLLSMAMAGLGLSVHFSEFKKLNLQVLITGVTGSIAVILLGFILVWLL